ncbi:MAG: hypothetical protein ACI86H_002284, partial [bacterium]
EELPVVLSISSLFSSEEVDLYDPVKEQE